MISKSQYAIQYLATPNAVWGVLANTPPMLCILYNSLSHYLFFIESVSDHCSCAALFIPRHIYVDVDGRSGPLCGSCEGVCD